MEKTNTDHAEILDKILIKNGHTFGYKFDDVQDSISRCKINGESVVPCAGYLVLAWHVLSKLHKKPLNETPVVFKDIYFKELKPAKDLKHVTVTILPSSGNFEICVKEKAVVTGNIREANDISEEKLTLSTTPILDSVTLNSKDIYQELSQRGYDYKNEYRNVVSADLDIKVGSIAWINDWIAFIDGLLQFDVLSKNTRNLHTVDTIDRIVIDPKIHIIYTSAYKNVNVYRYKEKRVIVGGGIQISGLKWTIVPKMNIEIDFKKYGLAVDKKNGVIRLENAIKKVERAHAISTGNLSTVQWVESPPLKTNSEAELCYVFYASLNHEDLVYASGKMLPGDDPGLLTVKERPLGMEFSGITSSGRKVMGLVPSGALATDVIADSTCLWDVPPNWPLECAAKVPMAFSTAYYALLVRGQMKPSDNIVIYCGDSNIGQAAIRLALHHGCRVFSTYNSREQRMYISSQFLEVKDQILGHDWHPDFEKMVLEKTDGRGVDIIFNLLGSKKLPAAISCLAKCGKILDILKGGTCTAELHLPPLLHNQSYQSINMASLTQEEKKIVSRLLSEGIRVGHVFFSPYTVAYSTDCLRDAFNLLKSEERNAKVTVTIRQETDPGEKVAKALISAAQRVYFDAEKSYLVIGGRDNVSMEFGHWLISRGATKIIFSTDSMVTGYQSLCVKRWQEQSIQVQMSKKQICNPDDVELLICEALQMGPIGGMFDLNTLGATETNGYTARAAIEGIKTLDIITRGKPDTIDHFVVMTSLSNNKSINSMIKVMESRRKDNMSGIIIQVRSNDVTKIEDSLLNPEAYSIQTMWGFFNSLDTLLVQPYSMVSCVKKNYCLSKH